MTDKQSYTTSFSDSLDRSLFTDIAFDLFEAFQVLMTPLPVSSGSSDTP
jgi:hypothetical protein